MNVSRTDEGKIFIHHGDIESIELSPFNAACLLACLSMVLDLPLTKAAQKAIQM